MSGAVKEVTQWLGIPSALLGIGLAMWLLLTRRTLSKQEHEERLAVERARCTEVAAVERRRSDEQMEAAELRIADLHNRYERTLADRDAWRGAHAAEVQARQAAERASAQLLDTHSISVQLLGALRDALRPRDGGVASGSDGSPT